MRRRALCWNALWNGGDNCGILRRRRVRGHVFVKRVVQHQNSNPRSWQCNKYIKLYTIYSNMCASNSRRRRIISLSLIVCPPVCRGVDGFSGVCTRVPSSSSTTSGNPGMGRWIPPCSSCRLGTNVIPVSSVSVSDVRGDASGRVMGVCPLTSG